MKPFSVKSSYILCKYHLKHSCHSTISRCDSGFFLCFFFFKVILKGFWKNWNCVFLEDKIIFMEARSAVVWTQNLEENALSAEGITNTVFCCPSSCPDPVDWPASCTACPQGVICTRSRICSWFVLRIKHALYLSSGDFRNSPFSSFARNITCTIWHFFHIEMKLFSEADRFQSLRFTLIRGSWQEINSHFFHGLLKRLSCRVCGLLFCLLMHSLVMSIPK